MILYPCPYGGYCQKPHLCNSIDKCQRPRDGWYVCERCGAVGAKDEKHDCANTRPEPNTSETR